MVYLFSHNTIKLSTLSISETEYNKGSVHPLEYSVDLSPNPPTAKTKLSIRTKVQMAI